MSITERKEREKAEMRQLILDGAHRIFKEKGYDGLNIRAIAEAIEYSPATIYLYFKDKNEIYFGLQYEAAKAKKEHFEPVTHIEDPWERLKAFGQRYIEFGLQYPDWYNLIFITRAPMDHIENQASWQLGISVHQFFVDTVQACVDHRYFKSTDAETIAFTLWCYAHGVVSLFIRERMRMYPEPRRLEILQKSYPMLVKMAETL
jgi:AcrR family transcriptional regulator